MPEVDIEHGRVGIAVRCVACGQQKAPHGRSAPMGAMYCQSSYGERQCPGYWIAPMPGCLWPGETCESFGYAHCHHATAEVIRTAEESTNA